MTESMTEKSVVDKIVTNFILNTCRLRPQLCQHSIQAAVKCAEAASFHFEYDEHNVKLIPLISGSVAEFYIEPMLPHVGDVDIMHHTNTELAIPRGHPPPTQLPAEFHNYVRVYEIIDSPRSGYVYLELRYLLRKCTDSDRYNASEYEKRGVYLTVLYEKHEFCLLFDHLHVNDLNFECHGPAYQCPARQEFLPTDLVNSVRCLSWPSQAADWPSRQRNHGWPDSATVDGVVSNGCDVVQVAHRQCRHNESLRKLQCRLSFSRAEIVLINSWMPVQQIVYHLLRVFVKTEQLIESANNPGVGTLSNYHIKTLMLWACEQMPKSFWTDDLNLIRISLSLLHMFAVWLTEARHPHFFISNCNVLEQSFALHTSSRLLSIDEDWLSSWFVTIYIRQSVDICPENISRLFVDVSSRTKLENAVSEVVNWRLNTASADMWHAFGSAMHHIVYAVSTYCPSSQSCVSLMTELSKIDARFSVFYSRCISTRCCQNRKRRFNGKYD